MAQQSTQYYRPVNEQIQHFSDCCWEKSQIFDQVEVELSLEQYEAWWCKYPCVHERVS